jgi:hypothetical protein
VAGDRIAFEAAEQSRLLTKSWPSNVPIAWAATDIKSFPRAFKFRTALLVDSVIFEGLFVELYYKQQIIPGIPDSFSAAFIANACRIVAIDHNGARFHLNKVGKGQSHYQQSIGMPHLHFPVPDAAEGYAEPLSAAQSLEALWRTFLFCANILNGPQLTLPSHEQMDLL